MTRTLLALGAAVLGLAAALALPAGSLSADESARSIPDSAQAPSFTARLVAVSPWCDHMPGPGPQGGRRHLVARVTLTNRTGAALAVALDKAFVSFDADGLGGAVTGLSVRGASGEASGATSISLGPREERTLELRGDGLFDEGKHGATLWLSLVFATGEERAEVRKGGEVIVTQ